MKKARYNRTKFTTKIIKINKLYNENKIIKKTHCKTTVLAINTLKKGNNNYIQPNRRAKSHAIAIINCHIFNLFHDLFT